MDDDRYQILAASNIKTLENYVNNEIRHGWVVTGGLAVYLEPSKEMLHPEQPVFVQAMIKPPEMRSRL